MWSVYHTCIDWVAHFETSSEPYYTVTHTQWLLIIQLSASSMCDHLTPASFYGDWWMRNIPACLDSCSEWASAYVLNLLMYSLNKSLVGTKPGNVGKAELVIGTLLPALRSSKILLFVSVVASGIPLADLLIAFVAQQAAGSADPFSQTSPPSLD